MADPPGGIFTGENEGSNDGGAMQVQEGMYILTNKKSRTVLDLAGGNAGRGIKVQGCRQDDTEAYIGNQLWIIKRDGLNDTYTVKNLQGGTFLDLLGGERGNGSRAGGWPRELKPPSRANQEWLIEEREPEYYTIRCSRTNTFLEVPGGNPGNCTAVTCSGAAAVIDHQLWCFEPVSRTGSQIRELFTSWKPNFGPLLLQTHGESAHYFILPHQLRRNRWRDTGLVDQPVRPHLFDHDHFAINMKNAVTVWVRNRYQRADIRGYCVLFGMIYGKARRGPTAYNWYLSQDLFNLVFFDAQSGKEYSAAALNGFGFEPTFAVF